LALESSPDSSPDIRERRRKTEPQRLGRRWPMRRIAPPLNRLLVYIDRTSPAGARLADDAIFPLCACQTAPRPVPSPDIEKRSRRRRQQLRSMTWCSMYNRCPVLPGNQIEHRTPGKVGTRLMNTNYCEFPRCDCLSMFVSAALDTTLARGVAISEKKARLAW
jgi:hypothetical protein